MPSATVTVGDTEVEIRETDDGFEAVEAEDTVYDVLEQLDGSDRQTVETDALDPGVYFYACSSPYGALVPTHKETDVRTTSGDLVFYYERGADVSHMGAWDSGPDEPLDRGLFTPFVALVRISRP